MQAKVPLDIGIEDQIIGPLSFRQLIMLLVGGGISYLAYKNLDEYTWPFIVVPTVVITLLFVFVKVNEMTFFQFLIAGIIYLIKPQTRIWKQLDDWVDKTQIISENSALEKYKYLKHEQELQKKIQIYQYIPELTLVLDRFGFINNDILESAININSLDDDMFFYKIYRKDENYNFEEHYKRIDRLLKEKQKEVKESEKIKSSLDLEEAPQSKYQKELFDMIHNIENKFADLTMQKFISDAKNDLEQIFQFKKNKSLKTDINPHLKNN